MISHHLRRQCFMAGRSFASRLGSALQRDALCRRQLCGRGRLAGGGASTTRAQPAKQAIMPSSRDFATSGFSYKPSTAGSTASAGTATTRQSESGSVAGALGSGKAQFLLRPERVRRTLFNVPGNDQRKLAKAQMLQADSIVFDLEDGVPYDRKGAARELVFDALETMDLGCAEKAVRINSVGSGLELDDLNVVLRASKLQCIVIPKVNTAKDVEFVDRMIDTVAVEGNRGQLRLIACIESAMGLMNLREITAASPRLDALVLAAEDLCADMGMVRTAHRRELAYARAAVVTAACAAGLQAIDIVCVDYKDSEMLEAECAEARQMGYAGKQAIHPAQIAAIHAQFSPTPTEIELATRIVEGYREHAARGIGAYTLDGKVVDLPVLKWVRFLSSRLTRAGHQ